MHTIVNVAQQNVPGGSYRIWLYVVLVVKMSSLVYKVHVAVQVWLVVRLTVPCYFVWPTVYYYLLYTRPGTCFCEVLLTTCDRLIIIIDRN